jgi:hypothetical protein
MQLLVRDAILALGVVSVTGCSGLLADAPASRQDGGTVAGEPGASSGSDASTPDASILNDAIPDVSIPDAYGARFLGDADQCAAVVCGGSQVCCVVPIPSDAPTAHPDNKCDYDCTAQCMDSCPVISLGSSGAAPAPAGNGSTHGGAVALPADDAGVE